VATGALERPELRIIPRKDLVARLGISTQGLAETIRVATIGDVGPALAQFDAGDRLVPIRVQLEESARGDRQTLERLKVPMGGGNGSVPLVAISDIDFGQGPITIFRYDRNRRATIEADLVGGAALGDALAQVRALPVMKGLPPGITVDEAGDAETMQELFGEFSGAMRDGLMMVFALLVLLFGSFLQPITILFSLPLSIGGVIGALLLVSKPISMPVIIGILMLMGIVTKNAIMLVDFAIESMHAGMDRATAIVEACQKRARPIVMTTVAMIAGMAPSALAFGAGGEFRSPMAIAVIGGLLVSTVLSLLFVPAFFALMDDLSGLGTRLFSRLIGPTEEPPHPAPQPAPAE
jgi:multidrug efflux pump subunit AcrB